MSLEQVVVHIIKTFKKHSGADGDAGELNQAELAKLVKEEFPILCGKGKDEAALKEVMKLMDLDGDKSVSFKEFAFFIALLSMELEEEDIC
ncbi:protein S100-A4-like [Ambystoma mexicanum]|uniref:protein S100-A4-like n=1 Tax=Ambystoma mexicanum TaxID=8296 RepID=UPI0037E82D50